MPDSEIYCEKVMNMYQIKLTSATPLQMGGRYTQDSGWIHSGRSIERNFLFYLEEGNCTFWVGSTRTELTPGDILVVPRGAFYAPSTQEGCTYLYFHFAAEIIQTDQRPAAKRHHYSELIEETPMVFHLPEHFQADTAMRFSMETILRELTSSQPRSAIRMNLAFFQFLLQADEAASRRCGSTLALEMEAWLRQHAHCACTLDDLIRHFGYTRQYLIRVFRKQFGTTPIAFLNEWRLSQSVRYLLETDLTIDEIAHRCGFEDGNYFSRLFKQKYRLPPSVYRRQAAGI